MSFVPHHHIVCAPQATPQRYLLVLHGVFGSGKNWRLFMRKLVAQCPQWGAVLVDVRGHGDSLHGAAPHNIAAVADDLVALERTLPAPVRGICGHSLGGKLALGYAAKRRDQLQQVWILDSRPGVLNPDDAGTTERVLKLLQSLPKSFTQREHFVAAIRDAGLSDGIARWLAMNLRRTADNSFELSLELDVIAALLDSYYATDMWSEVEADAPQRTLHQVIGTRSEVWDAASQARLRELTKTRTISVHELDAGHWVHADAPTALFDLLLTAFSQS